MEDISLLDDDHVIDLSANEKQWEYFPEGDDMIKSVF